MKWRLKFVSDEKNILFNIVSSILSYLKPKSNVIAPGCYIPNVVIGHGSHPKRRRGDPVRLLGTDDLVRPLRCHSEVLDEVIVPFTACSQEKKDRESSLETNHEANMKVE